MKTLNKYPKITMFGFLILFAVMIAWSMGGDENEFDSHKDFACGIVRTLDFAYDIQDIKYRHVPSVVKMMNEDAQLSSSQSFRTEAQNFTDAINALDLERIYTTYNILYLTCSS